MEWDHRTKKSVEGIGGQAWGDLEIGAIPDSALSVSVWEVHHFPTIRGPVAKLR